MITLPDPITPGIYRGVSFEDYQAANADSRTDLTYMDYSPAHYLAHKEGRLRRKETPALAIGTKIHDMALEGKEPQNVAIKPDGMSFATREGKAWRDEQLARNMEIMTRDDYEAVYGIAGSVALHRTTSPMFEKGDAEVMVVAQHPELDVLLKARFDWLPPGNTLPDVKSCICARPEEFFKSISNFDYHAQAALYLDIANWAGLEKELFVWIAVEKTPPFALRCYYMAVGSNEYRDGVARYSKWVDALASCREDGVYPGYPEGLCPIEFPKFHTWSSAEAMGEVYR